MANSCVDSDYVDFAAIIKNEIFFESKSTQNILFNVTCQLKLLWMSMQNPIGGLDLPR